MREGTLAFIISLFLLVSGILFYFLVGLGNFDSSFNFYRSDLSIEGLDIQETLHFYPTQEYHTLYRNFVDGVFLESQDFPSNSILILNVSCKNGFPYVFTDTGQCVDGSLNPISCMDYTEQNEYGCSFGNTKGFSSNMNYDISSTYRVNPENIFLVDGKEYIKFVAYSSKNHLPLEVGKTLFIEGGGVVFLDKYPSQSNVIIYIPLRLEDRNLISNPKLLTLNDFEFDDTGFNLGVFLLFLVPGFLFFGSWFFFGKENNYLTPPDSLSVYPKERKPWEVAAFFSIPIGVLDSRFYSSLLINLFHNKVLLIEQEGKDIYLKINSKFNYSLDEVEQMFVEIFNYIFDKSPEKYKRNGFLDLKKASVAVSRSFFDSRELRTKGLKMEKLIRNKSKEYVDSKGIIISIVGIFLFTFLTGIILKGLSAIILFSIFSCFIFVCSSFFSNVLRKYKENYYEEYLNWKSFRKFLNYSSLKYHGHKGVIVWEKYLMYGAALGISKKVIKELQQKGLISDEYYQVYVGSNLISNSIMSSGASGHSGAGGGGVGGGGGGGR